MVRHSHDTVRTVWPLSGTISVTYVFTRYLSKPACRSNYWVLQRNEPPYSIAFSQHLELNSCPAAELADAI